MHIRVQLEFTTMCNEKYVSIEHDRTNGRCEHEYMRMRVILSSTLPDKVLRVLAPVWATSCMVAISVSHGSVAPISF